MGQFLDKARAARDALAAARSTSTPSKATETQAFKAWFGDSKVVDAEGRPLVVFHGTDAAAFAEFKIPAFFTSDRHGADWYLRGEEGRVEELYLSIRKPFDIRTQAGAYDFITLARQAGVEVNSDIERDGGPWMFEADEVAKHSPYDGTNMPDLIYIPAVQAALQAHGYDGLLVSDTLENGEIPVWVAIRADQIKRVSAAGLLDDAAQLTPANPLTVALHAAREQYRDLLTDAHKKTLLSFTEMAVDQFHSADGIDLHASPANDDGTMGSVYRLVMIDGEPVWARGSNHWGRLGGDNHGTFWWDIGSGERFGEYMYGYITLHDLERASALAMTPDGWMLDDANLSAMERVRIAAQIAKLIARFKDAGTGMRARLKAAQDLRVLIGRLASAPSIVADEHPAMATLRRLVIAKYKDVNALRSALDEIGDSITALSVAGAFDGSAADVANEAITTWAQAEEQEKEGAAE